MTTMPEVEGGRTIEVEVATLNEQVILGAAVAGWDTGEGERLLNIFQQDHFLADAHAGCWGLLGEMRRKKLAWDPATAKQLAAGTVDTDLLFQIVEARPEVPPNLEHHIEAMIWDRMRVGALRGPISALIDAIRDPRTEPERVQSLSRQVLTSLDGGGRRRHLYRPRDLAREVLAEIDKRARGIAAYPTGLDGLDFYESADAARNDGMVEPERFADSLGRVRRIITGLAPENVVLVTSVSGGGKTTLLARMVAEQAKRKRRVLLGAFEIGVKLNLEIIACIALGYSRTALMLGMVTAEERTKLDSVMRYLDRYVLLMSKKAFRDEGRGPAGQRPSNERNLDTIASYIADTGADVFVADLWERCLVSMRPEDEKHALNAQQAMAEEMKFCAVLAQQQRIKDVEQRPDKRPTREGTFGSQAYIDVSDLIVAPHRPALWKSIPDDRIELYLLKQRYGKWPCGVECGWDGDTGQITGGKTIRYDLAPIVDAGDLGAPARRKRS